MNSKNDLKYTFSRQTQKSVFYILTFVKYAGIGNRTIGDVQARLLKCLSLWFGDRDLLFCPVQS